MSINIIALVTTLSLLKVSTLKSISPTQHIDTLPLWFGRVKSFLNSINAVLYSAPHNKRAHFTKHTTVPKERNPDWRALSKF